MLRKRKTYIQLLEECANYDFVIVNDPALVDSLMLYGKTSVSNFIVPKHFVPGISTKDLILELFYQMKNIKKAYSLSKNISLIWENTGSMEKLFEYAPQSKKYKDLLKKTKFYNIEFFNKNIFKNKKIAVLGLELFSELDKKILPEKYAKIELFGNEFVKKEDLPKLFLFDTEHSLFSAIKNIANKHVAFVISDEDKINIAIKQHLKVVKNETLGKLESTAKYISFLEHCLTQDLEKNKDIEYFIRNYFDDYDFNLSETYITRIKPKITFFCNELCDFVDAYNKLKPIFNLNDKLFSLISLLKLKTINWKNIQTLKYYLENIDVELGTTKGSFVISPHNAFIPKKNIFLINPDDSFMAKYFSKPYIKNDFEKDKTRFELLLQSGKVYIFAVKLKGFKERVPAYYFDYIFDINTENFEALKDVFESTELTYNEFYKKEIKIKDIAVKDVKITISKSSKEKYDRCPASYVFHKVIKQPLNYHLELGILIHSFAENYLHKKEINTNIFEKLLKYIPKHMEREYKHNINNFIENTKKYIDSLQNKENIKTEVELNKIANIDERIRGRIDLLLDRQHIVDLKTGIDKTDKLQAKFYFLTVDREKPAEFIFKFLKNDTEKIISYIDGKRSKITKKDLEEFEQELLQNLKDIENYYKNRFPYKSIDCSKCPYKKYCFKSGDNDV